jgi:hypothetical protein
MTKHSKRTYDEPRTGAGKINGYPTAFRRSACQSKARRSDRVTAGVNAKQIGGVAALDAVTGHTEAASVHPDGNVVAYKPATKKRTAPADHKAVAAGCLRTVEDDVLEQNVLRAVANRVLSRNAILATNDAVSDIDAIARSDTDATSIQSGVAILDIQLLEYPAAGSVVWSSQRAIEYIPIDVTQNRRATTFPSKTDAQVAIVVESDGLRDDVATDGKVDRPPIRTACPIHRILDCRGIVGNAVTRRAEILDIFDFRQSIWHGPSSRRSGCLECETRKRRVGQGIWREQCHSAKA